MSIKVYTDFYEVPITVWDFPGGEVGIKLDLASIPTDNVSPLIIDIVVEGKDHLKNLMLAMQAKNAFESSGLSVDKYRLLMDYFPYARQDRVCHTGEAFALSCYVQLLAQCDFDLVEFADAHSEVTKTLLNTYNVPFKEYNQSDLLHTWIETSSYDYFIAPDAGAAKKLFGCNVLQMEKTRKDGQVIYEDFKPDVKLEGTALVVDDICDGGATFISLAKMMKRVHPDLKLSLYVTHGIFSKGKEVLEEHFHRVMCYNDMSTQN